MDATPEQQAEENSVRFGLIGDAGLIVLIVLTGILGGSLTILAEAIRTCLMILSELFSFVVMRRIHRGQLGHEFVPRSLFLVATPSDTKSEKSANAPNSDCGPRNHEDTGQSEKDVFQTAKLSPQEQCATAFGLVTLKPPFCRSSL